MGLDARRANRRSVLITDVHISGADCIFFFTFLCIFYFVHQLERSATDCSVMLFLCVSVPTVKMPRMLVTSAYALQQLLKKTELIGQSAGQVSSAVFFLLILRGAGWSGEVHLCTVLGGI